jgi:hypothetical protein
MNAMTVVCGCGRMGTVAVPYTAFALLSFVLGHHEGEETVPSVVTLVCACGVNRLAGPGAEPDKDAFTAGAEFIAWMILHENCQEVLV